ncbi:putative GTP-binding protein Rhes-like [Apostichopus japonicus]|uniref:Putative GTP-binding protein Rhes-like n=1 Tax=Stichopus japonicus TaxID=307972 RepID=A0A2G8KSY0_STIJA|nr:putative GTP-binding protein Rhes-like [Apostichopus japonicus]
MGNAYSSAFSRSTQQFFTNEVDTVEHLRVAIFGATFVGKSSIVSQIVSKTFPLEHKTTLDETVILSLASDKGVENVRFLDTSGTFVFPAMRQLYIANSHIFLVVYSLDMENSFEEARKIVNEIQEQRPNENIPILLLGNKKDIPKEEREISAEVADLLAIDWDVTEHIFTSAASYEDNVNVLRKILSYSTEVSIRNRTSSRSMQNRFNSACRKEM